MNVILSFSQNKQKPKTNNSALIAKETQKLVTDSIHLQVMDYQLKPCILCGKCASSKTCVFDEAFNNLIRDIGNPESLILVVPYYSPLPSTLMIFLEKLNEIFYASWIKDKSFKHQLNQTPLGLIVHGGYVDQPKVIDHYQKVINQPLSHTFKSLGFQFMEDSDTYKNGIAFGLEDESKMSFNEDEIFPDITHCPTYIQQKITGYISFIKDQLN